MTATTTAGVATVVDVDAAMDVDAVEAVNAALVEAVASTAEAVSSDPTHSHSRLVRNHEGRPRRWCEAGAADRVGVRSHCPPAGESPTPPPRR